MKKNSNVSLFPDIFAIPLGFLVLLNVILFSKINTDCDIHHPGWLYFIPNFKMNPIMIIYRDGNGKDPYRDFQVKPSSVVSLRMLVDFGAGLLGGAAGVLVGHPFDTVKVHMQMDDPRNPRYKGTLDCLKTIIKKDGVRGLYRGITSPIGGIGFVNAIVFGVYGNVQRLSADPNSLMSHFYAGSVAGVAQSFVCAPMELAKTRLQLATQIDSGIKFRGPIHCLSHILKTEGIRATYKGLVATIFRDIPGFASYFVSYELLMRQMETPSILYTLAAGGLAGCTSWLFCYPVDVVKTHMQADALGKDAKYKGFLDCAIKGFKSDGLAYFFRGLNSTLIRSFPMNATTFFVVSLCLKFFDKKDGMDSIDHIAEQPLNVVTLENTKQTDFDTTAPSTVEEVVRKIITENAISSHHHQYMSTPKDVVHSQFTSSSSSSNSNTINIPKESKKRLASDCNLK